MNDSEQGPDDRHAHPEPQQRPHRHPGRPARRGAVQRLSSRSSVQAGGQGVNIRGQRCRAASTPRRFPGPPRRPVRDRAHLDGHRCRPAPPAGRTSASTWPITEPDGTTTKLNSPGAIASASTLDDLGATSSPRQRRRSWVVLAGSFRREPPTAGTPSSCGPGASSPARVAVDTSEGPLAALVRRCRARLPTS